MERMGQVVHDLWKVLVVGLLSAAAAALVLFAGGFLLGGAGISSGLEAAKDGLLLVGSLGLFILAGMLITKGKKPERFRADNGWRNHFQVIGPKTVIGILSIAFLLAASLADGILLLL